MTFYIIDFDTRKVESKSEDEDILAGYILDNDLDMAVALVGSAEDLEEQFTDKEISEVYYNSGGKENSRFSLPSNLSDEEIKSQALWQTLEENSDNFPKFTKALGKRLLKAGNAPSTSAEDNLSKHDKPKAPKQNKGIRASELLGMVFCCSSKKPRNGTAFAIITDVIEDNMDEASFDELVQGFIDNYVPKTSGKTIDQKFASGYIRGAFNEGYIEEGL